MIPLHTLAQALREAGETRAPLFPEGHDPQTWRRIRHDPAFKEMVAETTAAGAAFIGTPIRAIPFSLFQDYAETGSRKPYEYEYFEHRKRLVTFTLLCLLFPEELRYRTELENIVWAVCDEFTWALPAHLPGGGVRPEMAPHPARVIDLFNAETGYALAELCSLLGDSLNPVVVNRALREVRERLINPYLNDPANWWCCCSNNWAAVCGGSVGGAALYLFRNDPQRTERLAPLLHRVLGTLDSFLEGFGEDGACLEGLGYWNYGFGYYTIFAALLHDATAGRIDLFAPPRIEAIARFQEKVFLSGNAVASFSDGSRTGAFDPGLSCRLAKRFPGVSLPAWKDRAGGAGIVCFPRALRRFVWADPALCTGLAAGHWFLPDAQWFLVRLSRPGQDIGFAAKGGHNDEPHNHNDLGSFLLAVNGEQLLADLGAGEYTRAYFGPDRYRILTTGSQGHSVPVVEGCHQKAGRECAATVLDHAFSPETDRFSLEIGPAYGHPNLLSLVRTFVLEKKGDIQLRVTDAFRFEREPVSVFERFMFLDEPRLVAPGLIRIAKRGFTLDLTYPPACRAVVKKESFIDSGAKSQDAWMVELAATDPTAAFALEIRFRLH